MNTNETIVLVSAFRYTLGRMTYAVGAFVDYTHERWPEIPTDIKELMVREIKEYRDRHNGKAGMDMDDKDWETIITRFYYGVIENDRHRV